MGLVIQTKVAWDIIAHADWEIRNIHLEWMEKGRTYNLQENFAFIFARNQKKYQIVARTNLNPIRISAWILAGRQMESAAVNKNTDTFITVLCLLSV